MKINSFNKCYQTAKFIKNFIIGLILTTFTLAVFSQSINHEDKTSGQSIPTINKKFIHRLEKNLSMPKGAKPLELYDRYYTLASKNGRPILDTVMIFNGNGGAVQIVSKENMIAVNDGGCFVLNMRYDLIKEEVIYFRCNGMA